MEGVGVYTRCRVPGGIMLRMGLNMEMDNWLTQYPPPQSVNQASPPACQCYSAFEQHRLQFGRWPRCSHQASQSPRIQFLSVPPQGLCSPGYPDEVEKTCQVVKEAPGLTGKCIGDDSLRLP